MAEATEIAREYLSNPSVSLLAYGSVVDQENVGQVIRFDPHKITTSLQATILGYVSNPPTDAEGRNRWLTLLGYRQSGKSTTGVLSFYPKAAYNPGWDHVTIADTRPRADYLHQRLMLNHDHWPDAIAAEQMTANEVRQLTFKNHSKMRVLSAHAEAVGIGQSIASMLASEVAFWKDPATQFSMIYPAIYNRRDAYLMKECTPAPLTTSAAEYWQDECLLAKMGGGRALYAMFPFWDGLLNRRPWPKNSALDSEEERLMAEYGHEGLQLENLAFRRETINTDVKIRRNPELFGVYYPFDDVTCWIAGGVGTIPGHAMSRHVYGLHKDRSDYEEYEDPESGALYLIMADPAGYGVRDHAAFHIFKMWADEKVQVASFAAVIDPTAFAKMLFEKGMRFNGAQIVVERNGVGTACTALLQHMGYRNLYYDAAMKPGLHKGNHEHWMSILVDALMGNEWTLKSDRLVAQLRGYRSDKAVERSVKAELLTPDQEHGRRGRHHWDMVSALMVGAVAAQRFPRRNKPREQPDNVVMFSEMTWDQLQAYDRQRAAFNQKGSSRRRAKYVPLRRRKG